MNSLFKYIITCLLFVLLVCCGTISGFYSQDYVSPLSFGWSNAKNGIERYEILYKCHRYAVDNNKKISYKGINHICLEIPPNAKSIPLAKYTDFAGVTIEVVNNSKAIYLFQLSQDLNPITVDAESIDLAKFNHYPLLCRNNCLLVIKDKNPWVKNRKGYSFGADRKDIMLITNGNGKSRVVKDYSTVTTSPSCEYCYVDNIPIVCKNITLIRSEESTFFTFLFYIENQANVTLSDITIKTPEKHSFWGDTAISINNVWGLNLEDIQIFGTYSQKDKYGYGLYLTNITNLRAIRLYGHANWGIFGCFNINHSELFDCDINRFDIHCYGKDVYFKDCKFSGLYNQFSSVYGVVSFDNCEFTSFTPLLIESSYNAYTSFDVEWRKCVFNLDGNHRCLLSLRGLSADINTRPELSRKCVPNIRIENCTINVPPNLKEWYVIDTGVVDYKSSVDNLNLIEVSGLTINGGNPEMHFLSQDIRTTEQLKVISNRIIIYNGN